MPIFPPEAVNKMGYKQWVVLAIISTLLYFPAFSDAQNWSGVLNASRAIDWTTVPFSIPSGSWTQCGSTISAYLGTAALINNAIASCGANHYVLLGPGVFNLSSGISFAGHSNVALRGSGPLKTIIKFTGNMGCYSGNCHVLMAAASNTYDQSSANLPGGSNSLSITGTTEGGSGVYPQGATHLTVSNVGSDKPVVGTLLVVDQADDTEQGSGWMQCNQNKTNALCSYNGGSNGRIVNGVNYDQVQVVQITNISGSNYTISPGLYANNMRSSQTPGAWWNFNSGLCTQCGIENLTLDHGGDTSVVSSIVMQDCYQCWIKNIRDLYSGTRNHLYILQSAKGVIRDSYFFGENGPGGNGGGYGFDSVETSDFLFENNISDEMADPFMFEDTSGTIVGYTYSHNNVYVNHNFMQVSYPSHDPGNMMNLIEGNDTNGFSMDTQHGNSPVPTLFRNKIMGNEPAPNSKTGGTNTLEIEPLARGINVVGNVLGTITCSGGTYAGSACDENAQCTGGGTCSGPKYHIGYESSPNTGLTAGCEQYIYLLGWSGYDCASGDAVGNDPSVASTMMRWGNFDTVTGAVRWNSNEVPTSGTNFINALSVPSTHTLAQSWYYSSQPSWYASGYGNPPWPPIGPDVVGGDLLGVGGFAYRNPARLCFENVGQDSTNYPGTAIISFDANTCYGDPPPPPAPPTGLTAVVQ
jgi:hypothetical protein